MTKNKAKEQTALQTKEKSERELALAILLEVEKGEKSHLVLRRNISILTSRNGPFLPDLRKEP